MTTSGGCKIVFHAFSAFVGTVKGQRQCAFWTEDPSSGNINWDPSRLVTVDLGQSPARAQAGQIAWDQVDVDDFTLQGGLTTLGPMFPGGAMIGGVWLSEAFMKRNGLTEAHKPQHAHGYEFRMVLYADTANKVQRFQGFHAKVLTPAGSNRLTQLRIWNAGAGRGNGHSGVFGIDLDDISDTSESALTRSSGKDADGALYVDYDKKKVYLAGGGTGPKLPQSAGY